MRVQKCPVQLQVIIKFITGIGYTDVVFVQQFRVQAHALLKYFAPACAIMFLLNYRVILAVGGCSTASTC